MALPGVKLEDIKTVRSHPMALLQCQDYLSTLPNVTAIEGADTAESAKDIKDQNLKTEAAIASRLAAEVFGLDLLAQNIETDRSNFTRFLILARAEDYAQVPEANKSSIRFEVRHFPGSLARVLNIFNKHAVNLTKIQSLPILGKPYQYCLHADLEWEDLGEYNKAIGETEEAAMDLIHFGVYPRGEKVEL
jgi:prephenate dehydratase